MVQEERIYILLESLDPWYCGWLHDSKIMNFYENVALISSLHLFVEVVMGYIHFAILENKQDGCFTVKPGKETGAHM